MNGARDKQNLKANDGAAGVTHTSSPVTRVVKFNRELPEVRAMDTQAFASLAHVRILLVPVASISSPSFDEYASLIRNYQNIRLGDIPTGHKDERGRWY